ncbi:hypothetical protein BDV96DRAFT_650260 [Lophiotrema nucula]|uniref:DRBM domain-containing protein n=1 Tax=Lophiotrema nucula TaxID=690887 RepID=A0A6A5YWB2_9PLEO|nr:hypothetical protein BDV96DRAFT_650260 [Lophiotrema nucula]
MSQQQQGQQQQAQRTSWSQRLRVECAVRRYGEPTLQDVSDRRGGRTAWSCIAVIQGTHYQAKFWYDGQFLAQAREDAAEVAYRALTSATTESSTNSYYPRTTA